MGVKDINLPDQLYNRDLRTKGTRNISTDRKVGNPQTDDSGHEMVSQTPQIGVSKSHPHTELATARPQPRATGTGGANRREEKSEPKRQDQNETPMRHNNDSEHKMRNSDFDEVDNEYGMVIGSVKGKRERSAFSGDQLSGHKNFQDKSSNWSVISESKKLVNL